MKTITILQPEDDSLAGQLAALHQVFSQIGKNEEVHFDLSCLNWISPLFILSLSSYVNETGSSYTIPQDSNASSYLNTIHFPRGIHSISFFEQKPSYIPISVLKRKDPRRRERLETSFSRMVYKSLRSIPGTETAVYYPITELVTNIFEHSKKDEGWIFAQLYPQKKFLDLCILDRGRGLAKAYLDEKGLKLSDIEAIKKALRGYSVKPDTDRGYGIRTSKRVVCEGLNGSFLILSGSAALFSAGARETLLKLPNFYWQGVAIAYRIPEPPKAVDITPYLE